MKRLGVIGGMGPEATAVFYRELIAHTAADCDQEHIDTVVLGHASLPDRTKCILEGNGDAFLDAVKSDIRLLEEAGVSNIAIPCNTAHFFYDGVQSMTDIPLIHMVRETVKDALSGIEKHGEEKTIGIMATDGTVRAGVYLKECDELGIGLITPSPERQKDIMSLIYDDIKKGREPDKRKFDRAYEHLKERGASRVVLACTELSVYSNLCPVPDDCIDALQVLVREAVLRSGAGYRQ